MAGLFSVFRQRPCRSPARAVVSEPEPRPPAPAAPAAATLRGTAPSSWALRGLFLLALLWVLRAAAPLLFPVTLAVLLALLLQLPVTRLERLGLPRGLGAALVVSLLLGLVVLGVGNLRQPVTEWLADAPRSLARLEERLGDVRGPVEEASRAAERVEEITRVDDEQRPEVEIRDPGLTERVVAALPAVLAGAVVTIVLVLLLLVYSDPLLRNAVRAAPEMEQKRRLVVMSRQIQLEVSGYLVAITVINLGLGIAIGTALLLIGVPNPWLWGIMAGLLNYVPYLGGVLGVSVVAIVALVSLDDPGRALAAPLAYAVINSLEGMLLTPILLGRRFSLNPLVIFLWLLLWGWLWGIGGALIAVPLLTAFKIFCDETPGLESVGRMLAR
jgi:predicted PurR-regulated permease PerM